MAIFDNNADRQSAVDRANNMVTNVQSAVGQMRAMKASLTLYQAATDPLFNAAVNARFTGAERTELATVIGLFSTLLTDLDANHSAVLQA